MDVGRHLAASSLLLSSRDFTLERSSFEYNENGEIATAQLTQSVVVERIPTNVTNVANSSARKLTFVYLREFTQKNPLPVISVEMPPVTTYPLNSMSEFTLQRNYMNVIYVVKPLADALTLAIMRTHTGEKPYTLMNVEEPSASALTFTQEFPQGRHPTAFSQSSSLGRHRTLSKTRRRTASLY